MRAVAKAASLLVVAPLEPVKLPIRGAEASGCRQRGEIRARRFFHFRRQRALAQRFGKHASPRFEILQVLRRVAHGVPRVLKRVA